MKQSKIQRIDCLLRLKSTGSPEEFAAKLDLSRSTLMRYLSKLKVMGAPIEFCYERNSYLYTESVQYFAGFVPKDKVKELDAYTIKGGMLVPNLFVYIKHPI